MIKIIFKTKYWVGKEPKIIHPEDTSTFDQFSKLIAQMIESGLKPIEFQAQVSPFILNCVDSLIDANGNLYTKEGKLAIKTKCMKEPDFTEDGKKIKKFKFPGAEGLPKTQPELKSAFTSLGGAFDLVDITEYTPTNDAWEGPVSNPQALAIFEGKNKAAFMLYIGSNGWKKPGSGSKLQLPILPFAQYAIEPVELELAIKTMWNDYTLIEKKGPTLMSVETYQDGFGNVHTVMVPQDIKHIVEPDTNFKDLPLIENILNYGNPEKRISKSSVW